jgi:hypothetical protein
MKNIATYINKNDHSIKVCLKTNIMKKSLENKLRDAFKAGVQRGYFDGANNYFDAPLDENEYIESLKETVEEEKTIPITYGLIKATCGWCKWCDVTGGNHYAINEFGDYEDREVFYITKTQAKQLNFI